MLEDLGLILTFKQKRREVELNLERHNILKAKGPFQLNKNTFTRMTY